MILKHVSYLFLLSNKITAITPAHDATENVEYAYLDTKLPQPLSDMTATYLSSKIYLFGGCNSPEGNKWFNEYSTFVCGNVTDAAYAYDPESSSFEELKTMPRPRYRHATVAIDGKLWVVGGRDVNDGTVAEVDVYDPRTDEWTKPGKVAAELITSDLAAWSDDSLLCVTGGYDANYTAVNTTYCMDTTSQIGAVKMLAPLTRERGDAHVVVTGDYAYVVGGFTHANGWCAPHDSVERYSMKDNEWKEMNSLNVPRGDKSLVSLNGYIIAMGGETKIKCDGNPGEKTKPLNDVEYFNPEEGSNATWHNLPPLPDDRFRFSAAAYPPEHKIYVFGGQKYFDSDCMCFATSDMILSYSLPPDSFSDTTSDGAQVAWGLGVASVTGIVSLLI